MNRKTLWRAIVSGTAAAATLTLAAPSAHAVTGTLKKIKDTGTIVIGNRESSIPFSYFEDDKKPIGYSTDICLRVVDAIRRSLAMPSLRVEYKLVTSATRIPLVKDGSVDLECGSTTNNLDRQKEVAFSVTTFIAANRMVSKKSAGIRILLNLKNKPVVVTTGTTSLKLLKDINAKESYNMTILEGKDHAESFGMIEDGRALAFSMDDILLASLIANSKNPTDYVLWGQPLALEPYGIMMRRDDTELKVAVDDAIVALFKSGEIKKIYRKWFLSPIPPKGINLNVPMSETLERVIKKPTDSGNPTSYL